MKDFIKSWIDFWKPSVARKLTIYFIIFGFIVFYVTSIMYMATSVNNFIKITSNFIKQEFSSLEYKNKGDYIWSNIEKTQYQLTRLSNIIKRVSSEFRPISKISIYSKKNKKNDWYNIYFDKNQRLKALKTDRKITKKLDKYLNNPLAFSYPLLYEFNNTFSILINITDKIKDKHTYIIIAQTDKNDILKIIQSQIHQLIIFSLSILFISRILGYIFARKIANPIKILSNGAHAISKGQFDYKFKLDENNEIGELAKTLNIMSESINSKVFEIKDKINTMNIINQINKAVLSSKSRKELLNHVTGFVSYLIGCQSTTLALWKEHKKGYDIISFYNSQHKGLLNNPRFISTKELNMPDQWNPTSTFQINNKEEMSKISVFINEVIGEGVGSFINIPLVVSDKYEGSLVISRDSNSGFNEEEVKKIEILGDQIGVALQNVQLFEEKDRVYIGILIALTRTIDAKSKWTAGHSERVASLAERIGLQMNLTSDEILKLTISAVLHDIGKIGVPEHILDKKRKLSKEELEIINRHPQNGEQIIADIPFYDEIKQGILYHHERLDGSGYPAGLKGEKIPLIAQIIAVADVFDALTFDRPYRKGWSHDKVLKFMQKHQGTHFSEPIVQALIICHKKQG